MISKGFIFSLFVALAAPVIVGAGLIASSSEAQAATIRNIRIEGNRRVEPETVRSYLQFSPGDTYRASKVDSSLKALFATGLFSDVRINLSRTTVIVRVVENPIINKVVFEGNRAGKEATLKSEVQLKPRSVFTRAKVQSDVQRIIDVYRRQGRYAVQVDPKIVKLANNRVDLIYEITEGPDTKVKGISFIGNHSFTDSQLRDVINTSQTSLLSFLKPTNIYDPDRLNLDRELLRQFYLKNGFADARIISATADLDRQGSGFFITFTIEEGELYRFGNIELEASLRDINIDRLRSELLTKTGDIYNARQIDKSVENITLAIAETGYAFARVRPRVNRDPVSRTIGITYTIERGPRVYIERIDIIGNVRTRDNVIRREFRLVEGDAYNRLLVDRAKRRLTNLGFFKKVDIQRAPGSAPDRIILTVLITEQSTGEISFGAGFSSQEGVVGDISVSERNLLGRGQFVRLKFSGSLERAQVDFSFTEPRFLDRDLSAGFDAFHKEVDLTDESSYKSRKTGGALRFGFPLGEDLRMTTFYNLSRDQLYDVEDTASLAVKQAEGVATVSSVGYRLVLDKRNHNKNPSRGYYFSISQELAGVGGDVNFVRTIGEGRAYYPLRKKVTLVGRVIGGYISGWNGQDVRLLDTFYKGGETIRGFDRAGLGPRDATTGDALGGKIFYAGTLEVRFPIPLVPEELGFSGAVFVDAGSVYEAGSTAGAIVQDESSIRSSVGASLLWNSPLGPLRADFAYVLSSESFDDKEAFRFGAATTF